MANVYGENHRFGIHNQERLSIMRGADDQIDSGGLVTRITNALVQRVLTGPVQPGEWLRQDALAL